MADTQNKSVQYQEALFEAMKIVSQKQVESVSFDKTIEAVVTDASRAAEGIYQVSTGSSQFIAYSTETGYKQNDAVMVTIPQGNFDKQKMIIGKQVDDTDSPLIYKSPFQQFVNISNNLIYGSADLGTASYYANGTQASSLGRGWNISSADFEESNAYNYGKIWESQSAFFEQGFTRLGLSAQFSTWLDEYDVISGSYGLVLKVTFKCVDLEENNTFNKYFVFDSSEFFGNVYNFETFYMQEKLFNIEDFVDYPIVYIGLYAYQRNNFKTVSGDDLVYDGQLPNGNNFDFSIIQPNIFVKSPMVCLGIPVEDFESDTAEIFCDNGLTYYKNPEFSYEPITQSEFNEITKVYNADGIQIEKGDNWTANTYYKQVASRNIANKKNLQLRWVYKDSKTDTIATVEEDSLPEGYEIRWYRYSVGAQSPDEFAGAHWQRFYRLDSSANSDTGEWIISDGQQGDDVTNQIRVEFQPNVNRQEEKLKAIILKNEGADQSPPVYRLIAKSNIITFTNNDEVRSQATLIDANALSIRYDDDEKGHYFLYDESGEIGKNEDGEVRILTAVFDERPDGERELDVYRKPVLNIEECSRVVWTFPDKATMNTMVVPMDAAAENANVLNGYTITEKTASVGFTIKKQLNNNATQNRIRLDITKDGRDYSAWVEPVFGTAGDNGSDYKIILTWRDDKNALNLSKDSSGFLESFDNDSTKTALIGDVVIFDQAGDVVDWPEKAELKADWYVAEFGVSSVKQKEKEEEDIYYPVFRNSSNALNYNLAYNPDVNYQPAGYYYFVENPQNTGYNYVRFDPDNHTFTSEDINLTTDQLYRKRLNDSEKKNKLEFKKVQFTTEPLNQESGELNSGHGNVEPITASPRYEKNYYYSTNKKYFIKINDQYVLDPWYDYQEVETYYEPIEAKEKVYISDSVGDAVGGLTATVDSQTVTITANADVSMDSLFILQLTLKNFGDYDLVSYYPIALKNGETRENIASQGEDPSWQMTRVIQYIEGPDRVRYGSSGETDFKKNPYQIDTLQFENGNFVNYYHGYNNDNLQGYWKLLFPADSDVSNFDPVLKEDQSVDIESEDYVAFDKPLLSPSSVYIPDARPYGVQFVGYDSNNNEVTLWTQPILVYQNKYPSRTLNKWNGKDIETDNDAGTITASGFAAGRKERNNTFTGVVIGDWSRSKTDTAIAKNTGIYGFNSGAMSYAFKDDGTGFIGKDGKGRIYLDGDKSQIFSSKWANRDDPQGMLLDIDDGYIKMQSPKKESQSWDQNSHDSYQQEQVVTRYSNVETLSDRVLEKWKFLAQQSDQSQLEKVRDILRGYSYATVTNATTASLASYYTYSPGVGYTSAAGTTFSNTITYYTQTAAYITATAVYMNFTGAANAYTAVFAQQQVQYNLFSANDNNVNRWLYTPKNNSTQNFITIDATAGTYPLAIGDNKNVTKRGFRVKWDGTTYINNGEFSGLINAKGGSISGDLDVVGTLNGGILNADELNVYYGEIGGWTISRTELSGGGTTLSTINGITTNKGKIGGWTIDSGQLKSQDGNTILYANPGTGINIKTQTIQIEGKTGSHWANQSAEIGGIEGNNGTSATYHLGIKTSTSGLIFQTTHATQPIAIRGKGTVYLESGYQTVNNSVTRTSAVEIKQDRINLISGELHVSIPATAQFGIYARFA